MPDDHDPIEPPLASLSLTDEEKSAIVTALALDDPWGHEKATHVEIRDQIRSVKRKLSDLHMERQDGCCCYCRMELKEHGPFVRDREHILPKESFRELSYSNFNISISCKRCNMEIKKRDYSFVDDPDTIEDDPENAGRYYIVHPNFEVWEEHINRYMLQKDTTCLVFYVVDETKPKGDFTYKYFDLKSLSVDQFDEGQGVEKSSSNVRATMDRLLEAYDQKTP